MPLTNFTPLEQTLSDVLDDWALRGQGIVLNQKNPLLFIQILRTQGFEIVRLNDIQKVRHEQKVIVNEILQVYRILTAAKHRLELLGTEKDIIKDSSEQV